MIKFGLDQDGNVFYISRKAPMNGKLVTGVLELQTTIHYEAELAKEKELKDSIKELEREEATTRERLLSKGYPYNSKEFDLKIADLRRMFIQQRHIVSEHKGYNVKKITLKGSVYKRMGCVLDSNGNIVKTSNLDSIEKALVKTRQKRSCNLVKLKPKDMDKISLFI